jgi:hypothetical protein
MKKKDVDSKVGQDSHGLKLLQCVFDDDVFCSFRKDEKKTIMPRCFKCATYFDFMLWMDEEEEADGAFAEWAFKNPEAYARGEVP